MQFKALQKISETVPPFDPFFVIKIMIYEIEYQSVFVYKQNHISWKLDLFYFEKEHESVLFIQIFPQNHILCAVIVRSKSKRFYV